MRICDIVKSLPKRVLNFIRPHHVIVITYQFRNQQNITTSATIRQVISNNIDDALIYEPEAKVKSFRQFLRQGDIGYYAYINDKWVHRSWVAFGPKNENQWNRFAQIKLNQGDAFIKWCETSTEARGNNVYPAVLSQITKELKDKIENIYISTTTENMASHRGILKAGFVPIRETEVYSFLGIKYERVQHLGEIGYTRD